MEPAEVNPSVSAAVTLGIADSSRVANSNTVSGGGSLGVGRGHGVQGLISAAPAAAAVSTPTTTAPPITGAPPPPSSPPPTGLTGASGGTFRASVSALQSALSEAETAVVHERRVRRLMRRMLRGLRGQMDGVLAGSGGGAAASAAVGGGDGIEPPYDSSGGGGGGGDWADVDVGVGGGDDYYLEPVASPPRAAPLEGLDGQRRSAEAPARPPLRDANGPGRHQATAASSTASSSSSAATAALRHAVAASAGHKQRLGLQA